MFLTSGFLELLKPCSLPGNNPLRKWKYFYFYSICPQLFLTRLSAAQKQPSTLNIAVLLPDNHYDCLSWKHLILRLQKSKTILRILAQYLSWISLTLSSFRGRTNEDFLKVTLKSLYWVMEYFTYSQYSPLYDGMHFDADRVSGSLTLSVRHRKYTQGLWEFPLHISATGPEWLSRADRRKNFPGSFLTRPWSGFFGGGEVILL